LEEDDDEWLKETEERQLVTYLQMDAGHAHYVQELG
jgi:hypothetical protein